tara:strand:+ start:304 stop:546 length:243 start_codon:yes stop_codon:yes gene_type:complete
MLKELLKKNYKLNSNETHVYLSNVNKVLDEVRDNIKALQLKAHNSENYEASEAYKNAWYELAFVGNRILDIQIQNLIDKK